MKKLIISVVLAMFAGTAINAQKVTREGNTFVETKADKAKATTDTKTIYTYKTKDGKVYPIYLSKNGKAFIIRTSKKTGKNYKQYLPEVTEQLNPKK